MYYDNAVVESFQDYLGNYLAGQDVLVKISTREHKGLSGFWCWDLVAMAHQHVSRKYIRNLYPTRGEYNGFMDGMKHRSLRWKDVLRYQQKDTKCST